MRKFPWRGWVFLSAAVLVLGTGNTAAAPKSALYEELQERNGVYYSPATNAPYTGEVTSETTDMYIRGKMKNGKWDGTVVGGFDGGDGSFVCNYKNGKRHGDWKDFDGMSGGLIKLEHYRDDVKYNEWRLDYGGWQLFDGNGKPATVNYTNYIAEDGVLYNRDKTVLAACGNNRETFTIPKSVKSIGDDAFSGCYGMTSLTLKSSTPPKISQRAISSLNVETCILYVPKGSAYAKTSGWKGFKNIVYVDPNAKAPPAASVSAPAPSIADAQAEQRQAAQVQYGDHYGATTRFQPMINLYRSQLAECGGQRSEQCELALFMLGGTYFSQAQAKASLSGGVGGDYSMAVQTYQQFLIEYPESQYAPEVKTNLAQIDALNQQEAQWQAELQWQTANSNVEIRQQPAQRYVPAQQVAAAQRYVQPPQAVPPPRVTEALSARGKPKIAVYVFGADIMALNRAMATQLVTALVKIGRYQAAENYRDFFNFAAKDQMGNAALVNSKWAEKLGRQFGLDYVCLAEITVASGERRVAAHVYDVKTGELAASAAGVVPLKKQTDVVSVSEQMVNVMLKKTSSNQKTKK
jgi:hypothetical protein